MYLYELIENGVNFLRLLEGERHFFEHFLCIDIDCACVVCAKCYCACVVPQTWFSSFNLKYFGSGSLVTISRCLPLLQRRRWWALLHAHSDRSDLEGTGMSHGEQLSRLPPDRQRSTRHYALEWRHSNCCRKRHLHCMRTDLTTLHLPFSACKCLPQQSNQQENCIPISKEIYQSIKMRRSFRLDKRTWYYSRFARNRKLIREKNGWRDTLDIFNY